MKGKFFLLAGPSGVGKTTLSTLIVQRLPILKRAVSYTTRNPRINETCGVDFHFITTREFQRLQFQHWFLEDNFVFGNRYGVAYSEILPVLQTGQHSITEMERGGCSTIKKILPENTIVIFIVPPSTEELLRRLDSRAKLHKSDRIKRLVSIETELANRHKFMDYEIVNDDLEIAVSKLAEIIRKES